MMTVLLVFIVHLTLAGSLSIFGTAPNFLLLSTVFFAIRGGPVTGEFFGFFMGILSDIASMSVFGSQAFMLTLIGYLVGKLERQVDEDKHSAQMFLVFLMSCANILGLALLESFFGGSAQRFRGQTVLIGPFYSTLICPVVFWALLQWIRIFRRPDLKANAQ